MAKLPRDVERGFGELENNPFLVDAPEDKIGLADLDDLDGIGPSTVRKLRDAGIQEISDLYGLTQEQIARVDGIGPKKAQMIRGQIAQQGNRIQNRGFADEDIQEARSIHAERSKMERQTDETFNAKTALSVEKWKEDPSQFDMPGVDTIPRERRLERTKEATETLAETGLVDELDVSASGPGERNVSGRATGTRAAVSQTSDDPESTAAHELGHLADKVGGGRASLTNELFGPNMGEAETERQEELREQGAKLASRRRSISLKPDYIEEQAEKGSFGGGGFNEVLADAFAEAVEEPRRAKSEAPDLVREMQQAFQEQKDGFQTPF